MKQTLCYDYWPRLCNKKGRVFVTEKLESVDCKECRKNFFEITKYSVGTAELELERLKELISSWKTQLIEQKVSLVTLTRMWGLK